MTLDRAAANLRWFVQNGHMNEAWAVNQSSRGFTAQLSESWAYLSPYSAEQKKKHTLLSLHFLALSLPSTPSSPLPLLCDEWKVWILRGLPGFLSEALSSWTNNTLSNVKAQSGIYLKHVRFGCICVWPWSAREGTWKIDFCRAVITQNLDFLSRCNCKQTFYKLRLSSCTLISQNSGNEFEMN